MMEIGRETRRGGKKEKDTKTFGENMLVSYTTFSVTFQVSRGQKKDYGTLLSMIMPFFRSKELKSVKFGQKKVQHPKRMSMTV